MTEKVVKLRENVAVPASGLARLVHRVRDWNARRQAKAELRAMPNYLLNDIGVRRELIDQFVEGAVARRVASVVELDRNPGTERTDNESKAA